MEPMHTCKLFGAIKTILGIKNAIPIVHGPVGCAYHMRYLLTLRGGSKVKICSTQLSQEDVVFGAEKKLKDTIVKVDKYYKPDLIAVLTSCSTSIIGEDVFRVVKEIKNEINAEIIAVSAGGFEARQNEGYEDTIMTLIKELVKPCKKSDKPLINFIGMYRGGPDLKHLKNELKKMGIGVNCVLTSGCNIMEIRNLTKANLNYSFCDISAIKPSKFLKKKFGMEFIDYPFPIGFNNTYRFFNKILDFFDINYPLEKEYAEFKEIKDKLIKNLKGCKVAIISGPTRAVALTDFIIELGMEPVLISIDLVGEKTLKHLNTVLSNTNFEPEILIEPDLIQIEKRLKDTDVDIILGGANELSFSFTYKIPVVDVMHGQAKTMGWDGAREIARTILKNIKT